MSPGLMSRSLALLPWQRAGLRTTCGRLACAITGKRAMHSDVAQPIKAVAFGLWEVVISPWWFSVKDWEREHGLPDKALRRLARNDNSVFHKIFAGQLPPQAAGTQLIDEMKKDGMEVGKFTGRADKVGEQLTTLLATARVNGDVRDALQCLRFDGYQTALVTRSWRTVDVGSQIGKQGRETALKSEISRHFNAIVETEAENLDSSDSKVFELLCARLKLAPEHVAFVDRSEETLGAAREFGLTAIQADGPAAAVRGVEDLLDVPLANFAWTRDQYAKVLWGANNAPVLPN